MEFLQTQHKVLRGARADARVGHKVYLLKNVSSLHATYQVRLLAFFAARDGNQLVICVPKRCVLQPSLSALVEALGSVIAIEPV